MLPQIGPLQMLTSTVTARVAGKASVWRARTLLSENTRREINSSKAVLLDDVSFFHVEDKAETQQLREAYCRQGRSKSGLDWLGFYFCSFCIRLSIEQCVL